MKSVCTTEISITITILHRYTLAGETVSACTVQKILVCSYKDKQYKTNASRHVRNQRQRKYNNKNLSVSEAEFEAQGILKNLKCKTISLDYFRESEAFIGNDVVEIL